MMKDSVQQEDFGSRNDFIDFYELLQLNSNADNDTIERVFRHLAKKTHPDNMASADPERFRLIVEAHRTLSNPETRAGYDVKYQDYWNRKWQLMSDAGVGSAFGNDQETRQSLLSLLYAQRRRTPIDPGLFDYHMARLLDEPYEVVQFHLWYLKAKSWVERLDTGQLAISALGVDQVEKEQLRLRNDHLLTASAGMERYAERSDTGVNKGKLQQELHMIEKAIEEYIAGTVTPDLEISGKTIDGLIKGWGSRS